MSSKSVLAAVALVALAALGLAATGCGSSAEPGRTAPLRIGVVHMWKQPTEAPVVIGLRQGLKDLGYVEGRDVVLDVRGGKGQYDLALDGARQLVNQPVDILVSAGTKSTMAVHEIAHDIPIVFTQVGAPVKAGFVRSLAEPGGNTTGFTHLLPATTGKRLELLQELVPDVRTVLVIFDPTNATSSSAAAEARLATKQLGVQLQERHIKNRDEVLAVLQELDGDTTDAILILPDSVVVNAGAKIIEASERELIPVVFHDAAWVRRGGLASYGTSFVELARQAATYVDKIAKGAKPADLPVQQPTTFELVINLKSAEALGITVPESVLFRADETIR